MGEHAHMLAKSRGASRPVRTALRVAALAPAYGFAGNGPSGHVDPLGEFVVNPWLAAAVVAGIGGCTAVLCAMNVSSLAAPVVPLATSTAVTLYGPSAASSAVVGSPADALKHCILACDVTQHASRVCLGLGYQVVVAYEVLTGSGREKQMDDANNAVGHGIRSGNCRDACVAKLMAGLLTCLNPTGPTSASVAGSAIISCPPPPSTPPTPLTGP